MNVLDSMMPKLKQSGSEHVKIALLAMVSDPHQAQVMYFLPLEKWLGMAR